MRIATWNIGGALVKSKSNKYDQENLDYIISEIKDNNLDIIFLQEAHTPYDKLEKGQVEKIAKSLNYYFVNKEISPSHLDNSEQLSLGIISKYKLSKTEYKQILNPNLSAIGPDGSNWVTFDKGILFSKIRLDDNEILLICGHYHPFHHFAKDALDDSLILNNKELDDLLSKQCLNVIAGIDFNFSNLEKLVPKTFNCLKSAFNNVATIPKGIQQDFIMYSKNFNNIENKIINSNTDHYLCISELNLKN